MKQMSFFAFAFILALSAGLAIAADDHQMSQHQPGRSPRDFQQDYMEAMNQMHGPMMEGIMASDPDAAFVRGMIPHHQGAIEMAKIQLKYGQDPELRKLAQDIIDAQEKEIEFMEKWLKANSGK